MHKTKNIPAVQDKLKSKARVNPDKGSDLDGSIYRYAVENISSALILIGRDHRVIKFNKYSSILYSDLFNISMEVGESIFRYISEDYRPKIEGCFNRSLDTDENIDVIEGANGQEYWLKLVFTPIKILKKIDYVWITVIDFTERRVAIDHLAKNERRFKNLVKESSDIILIISKEGTINFASDSIGKILGYTPLYMRGKDIFELIHVRDRNLFRGLFEKVCSEKGEGFMSEIQFLHESGEYVYMETAGTNFLNDPDVQGIVLNIRDITYRKQIEAALFRINRQREMILESAGEGIFGINRDRKITFINPTAAILLGYREEEVIGEHEYNILKYLDERGVELSGDDCPIVSTLSMGKSHHFTDAYFRLRDGRDIPVEYIANPIREKDAIIGAVITFNDIVLRKAQELELKNAKEESDRANLAKSEFLANMSHEIRTPLNSIIGFIDILRNNITDYQQREYASLIKESAASLLSLINDILDLSKIEKGRLDLEIIEFNPHEEFEKAIELFSAAAAEKNIRYTAFIDPSIPAMIKGDPFRIKQILTNLIGNAVKFTTEGSNIDVVISLVQKNEGSAGIEFSVSDNGIGIDEDKKKLVLEAFTQADSSITRKFGGTGLGLAITNSLVNKMGGMLNIESEVGKGSEFSFSIMFEYTDKVPSYYADVSGKKIMLISDDPHETSILEKYINFKNTSTDRYASSADAAIIDMDSMKIADLESLRASFQGMPVACFLKYSDDDMFLVLKKMCDKIIIKPVTGHKLYKVLSEFYSISDRDSVIERAYRKKFIGRILVAEDNKNNQKLMKVMLEELGLDSDIAENGEIAYAKYRSGKFDLVLMDINMPVLDGFEALKMIRSHESSTGKQPVPVIALTAKAVSGDREDIISRGFTDYLAKPVQMQSLEDLLLYYLPLEMPDDKGCYDMASLSRGLGLTPEVIKDLLREFFYSIDEYISVLKVAVSESDVKSIEYFSHKLKGNSSAYRFDELTAILAEIENLSSQGKNADYKNLLSRVVEEIGVLKRFTSCL